MLRRAFVASLTAFFAWLRRARQLAHVIMGRPVGKGEGRLAPAPVRNGTLVGFNVNSHSGEFSPTAGDVLIPGRGLSFAFVRQYRSGQSQEVGPLGRGWTFTYAKRLEREGPDILYHDGFGLVHRFTPEPGSGVYKAPPGLYAVMRVEPTRTLLLQRFGVSLLFEQPEAGGRLVALRDANGNALNFKYGPDSVHVFDPLGREATITYTAGHVSQLRDQVGRVWQYNYNTDGCLIEVVQPAADEVATATRIRYGYDAAFRLTSITDPNGQTFLVNTYDEQGRVARQQHGEGSFEFRYEPAQRTAVRLKNGALLELTHDGEGHVAERTLHVEAEALSPEDRPAGAGATFPLTTKSKFNSNGEVIVRLYPAGNTSQWTYDETNADPLNRGNLLQVTQLPAPGVATDQNRLVTTYKYEGKLQQATAITNPRGYTTRFTYDPRGNLVERTYPPVTVQLVTADKNGKRPTRSAQLVERFQYNLAGQLVQGTDPRGAVTQYRYYSVSDPTGAKGRAGIVPDMKAPGGYLARILRDPPSPERPLKSKPANLVTEFAYDPTGNLTTTWDGKGNPSRLEYDRLNRLTRLISREPFKYEATARYDANGNPIEVAASFDRNEYDRGTSAVAGRQATVRTTTEYDSLNNPLRRTTRAGDKTVTHSLVRDPNENITRWVPPMGNALEYRYDARGLLLETRFGAGAPEQATVRNAHTPNGLLRARTDARGGRAVYHYDGFGRYKGFTNPGGTTLRRRLDEDGNIASEEVAAAGVVLQRAAFHHDELDRPFRSDRAWFDPATGKSLGVSAWEGEPGVVTTVIEYADNHRPAKVWSESGNVLSFEYDGANLVTWGGDSTGESIAIDRDENGNRARMERLGPDDLQPEQRFHQITLHQFDGLDRLVSRTVNGEPAESFAYNALGALTSYKSQAGVETLYLHDVLGRSLGQASGDGTPSGKLDAELVELDDNDRVVAAIDPTGQRNEYQYDALDRPVGVVYADGTTRHFERDGNGNIVRVLDANGNAIRSEYDSLDRIAGRWLEPTGAQATKVATYQFDAMNRLVAAETSGVVVRRRYDSLSRRMEESQGERTIRYGYDTAGNRTQILYPGGTDVRKSYDLIGRVAEIKDGMGNLIAKYSYRSSNQLREQELGGVLRGTFAYKTCQGCLMEVVYRSVADGKVVAGSRYAYDLVGNRTHEAQLDRGDNVGERYSYDARNRLVGVQYGVVNLSDPASAFDREVHYDLDAAGSWLRRTTRGPDGRVLEDWAGVTNPRHAYVSLGPRRFEYDKNGNRIREQGADSPDCAEKRYAYDYANRLIKVECLDASGAVIKSIEYAHDAFGRPVSRRLTDKQGKHESSWVWNGQQLIEEWEDGKLARSYVFGTRVNEPVQMLVQGVPPSPARGDGSSSFEGDEEGRYFYMFNGRGSVIGLANEKGGIAERYGYDVFGQSLGGNLLPASPLRNPHVGCGRVSDPGAGLQKGIFGRDTDAFGIRLTPGGGLVLPDTSSGTQYSSGPNPTSNPGCAPKGSGRASGRLHNPWIQAEDGGGSGRGRWIYGPVRGDSRLDEARSLRERAARNEDTSDIAWESAAIAAAFGAGVAAAAFVFVAIGAHRQAARDREEANRLESEVAAEAETAPTSGVDATPPPANPPPPGGMPCPDCPDDPGLRSGCDSIAQGLDLSSHGIGSGGTSGGALPGSSGAGSCGQGCGGGPAGSRPDSSGGSGPTPSGFRTGQGTSQPPTFKNEECMGENADCRGRRGWPVDTMMPSDSSAGGCKGGGGLTTYWTSGPGAESPRPRRPTGGDPGPFDTGGGTPGSAHPLGWLETIHILDPSPNEDRGVRLT